MTEFRALPDLARRDLGGSVVWANDESFAAKENLITPAPAAWEPAAFGHHGKVYDGWETRRRRTPGEDAAVVRLGVPGVVAGVVVDTAWFLGNFPTEASVDGATGPDGPWFPLVERSPLKGDTENAFPVAGPRRVTHVRLRIHPDGGVARLRVHGAALPDPALMDVLGTVDLAAIEHGGRVTGCSNLFYSSPNNLLLPGPARTMGEGWETARRRDDGNDWVEISLGLRGEIAVAELDTSWFLGNAPGWAVLRGRDGDGAWRELLPRTALLPDHRQLFPVERTPVTAVRLDILPDGGMARVRMHGAPTADALADLAARWAAAHP